MPQNDIAAGVSVEKQERIFSSNIVFVFLGRVFCLLCVCLFVLFTGVLQSVFFSAVGAFLLQF